jgi:cytochrome c peroxidase
VLEYDTTDAAFFGGNFFDARATGYKLQSPNAEQAQHPPVDRGEMGFPDTACIAYRLSRAVYRPLFVEIWGDLFDIRWPANTEKICDTPGGAAIFRGSAAPIHLSPTDRAKANDIYDHWGQSISKYERSPAVSAFSSKLDAFLAGKYKMTPDEMAGYKLFNGKANCNSCHLEAYRQPRSRARATPAATARGGRSSPASAMPISACRSMPTSPCFTRPGRIASGLRPILTASAIGIWDSAISSEAASVPAPIRTRAG